jgi:hypothetical protein
MVGSQANAQSNQSHYDSIVVITLKLIKGQNPSKSEISKLRKEMNCKSDRDRQFAGLGLILAMDKGLFPKAELLTLIEKGAYRVSSARAGGIFLNYRTALGLRAPPEQSMMDFKYRYDRGNVDEHLFSNIERQFVIMALANRDPNSRCMAGLVFVKKKDLSDDATKWAKPMLLSEVSSSKGAYHKLWEYVARVMKKRNSRW